METIDMITQVTMMVLYDDFASVCAPHVILIFEQNSLSWLAAEWLLRLPQVFQGSQARRPPPTMATFVIAGSAKAARRSFTSVASQRAAASNRCPTTRRTEDGAKQVLAPKET
ncbi:hypothetical protein BM221_010512 [Beauveria bassiana]|uniref:Uncharacterized protein n=1 Tax=Beauveria bassiana TaxID=176275 RepID=A0A2N6N919_BEABA|nr:hypothetical protein BM221_010512 [Beauveria bassiana]